MINTGVYGETTRAEDGFGPPIRLKSFEATYYYEKKPQKKFWGKKIFSPRSAARKTGFSSKKFFKSGFWAQKVGPTPLKPIFILKISIRRVDPIFTCSGLVDVFKSYGHLKKFF